MVETTTKQKIGLLLLSILLTLIILESTLRIGGFVILSLQRSENQITDDGDNVYRILALGESTTANLRNGHSSWPGQLEIKLNNRSPILKFKVFNEGIGGTNTALILSNLEDNLDKYNPDIVITMMGINDDRLFLRYDRTSGLEQGHFYEDMRVYKLGKLLEEAWGNKLRDINIVGDVSAIGMVQQFNSSGETEEYEMLIELGGDIPQ